MNDPDTEQAEFSATADERISQSFKSRDFAADSLRLSRKIGYAVPDKLSILNLIQSLRSSASQAAPARTPERQEPTAAKSDDRTSSTSADDFLNAKAPDLLPEDPLNREHSHAHASDESKRSQEEAPKLNLDLIRKWMKDEGYNNKDLAASLDKSARAVSSLRNNGDYHGDDAVTRLANLMKLDVEDLYLP